MKALLITMFGIGIGFAAGYYIAKTRVEELYEEEIDTIRELYSTERKKEESNSDKPQPEVSKYHNKPTLEELTKSYSGENDEEQEEAEDKRKLSRLTKSYLGIDFLISKWNPDEYLEEPDEYLEEQALLEEAESMRKQEQYAEYITDTRRKNLNLLKPYVISKDEYEEDEYDYLDKVELIYYGLDDVLTAIDDEIIDSDEIIELLGTDGYDLLCLGHEVVYVRNERFGTDYVVINVTEVHFEREETDKEREARLAALRAKR